MRFLASLAFVLLASSAAAAADDTILAPRQADDRVAVQELSIRNGVATARIVNRGSYPIRNVVLLVQYKYQWPKEFSPGNGGPGRSDRFTIRDTVAPGATYDFSAPDGPPSVPANGGHFDTVVRVMSFDEVIPPPAA